VSDKYETWAGPYVLGALSPAERDEYSGHLAHCPACRSAVEDLAGLPGLLSRVPPSVVDELAGDGEPVDPIPPLPDTLLPSLLRASRRRRRGFVLAVAGVAAAAALVLGVAVLGNGDAPPTRPPAVVAGAPMHVVGQAPISADLAVTSVGWGTKLDLSCQYEGYERGEAPYALVVVDKAGGTEQVGTWNAVPGKLVRMSAGTALRRADIRAVQVRTLTGRTVLALDLATAAG
jgi:hypothetical protein